MVDTVVLLPELVSQCMCAVMTAPALRLKWLLSFTLHTPAILILPSPERARSVNSSRGGWVCMCPLLFLLHSLICCVGYICMLQCRSGSIGNSRDLVRSYSMCCGTPTELVRAWPCFVLSFFLPLLLKIGFV